MLMIVFSVKLALFPVSGYGDTAIRSPASHGPALLHGGAGAVGGADPQSAGQHAGGNIL